jgi:glycosyltransferase 2 family protein
VIAGARTEAGRLIVILVALGALAALAVTHAGSADATIRALADTRIDWAVALLALAVAGPILHSGLLRAGQATVGGRFGHWEAIRLAAGIHAANITVRSAGAAGLGVLLRHGGNPVGPLARSAAYVLGRQVAHVAFAVLVLAALVLRSIDGRLTAMLVAGGAIFLAFRAAHVAMLWFAATRPQALPRWRRLDRVRALAPEFATLLRGAAADPRKLLRIASWAIALDMLRVGWLWVAVHAVGGSPSVDVAVETYGTVALLAMLSVLPAGLGAVDAGLAATLHHAGMPTATAVAGVLLFRVADLWVPLVAGARPALAAMRASRAPCAARPPRCARGRAGAPARS